MMYPLWSGPVVNRASQPVLTRVFPGGAKGTRTPDPSTASVIGGVLAGIPVSTVWSIVQVSGPPVCSFVHCVFAGDH